MAPSRLILLALIALPSVSATNPVKKVIELLTGLEETVIAQGVTADKLHREEQENCRRTAQTFGHEVSRQTNEVAELQAKIGKQDSTMGALSSSVDKLTRQITVTSADIVAATAIRKHEAQDFAATSGQLLEVQDVLERAIGILEREGKKRTGGAMLQFTSQSGQTLTQVLSVLVGASMFDSADADRLVALQNSQQSDDDLGAPDGAIYDSHSSPILDTLEDLLDKAQSHLKSARAAEQANVYNYNMLSQALRDQNAENEKNLQRDKGKIAETSAERAAATGALAHVSAHLAADHKALMELRSRCAIEARNYEALKAERAKELEAIKQAKAAIAENTGNAESHVYSFVQLASTERSAYFEAIRYVRHLARKDGSSALTQLAANLASLQGDNQIEKVKGLIQNMIDRLEKEGAADATEKAFCDKELHETAIKQDDMTRDMAKLTAKLNEWTARKNSLEAEIGDLQNTLAEIAVAEAEATALRRKYRSMYSAAHADLQAGLDGTKIAINALKIFYDRPVTVTDSNNHGAATGIIALLETMLSDFIVHKNENDAQERDSVNRFEEMMKAYAIEKTEKEQDIKYKTQEATDLKHRIVEAQQDADGLQERLNPVNSYHASLMKRCTEVAESYDERKGHRKADIEGLKEALRIMEQETALVQQRSMGNTHRTLRGQTNLARD